MRHLKVVSSPAAARQSSVESRILNPESWLLNPSFFTNLLTIAHPSPLRGERAAQTCSLAPGYSPSNELPPYKPGPCHRTDPGTGRWQRVNRLCPQLLALKRPFFSLRLLTFLGKKEFVLGRLYQLTHLFSIKS
jgi:hypothetical protein